MIDKHAGIKESRLKEFAVDQDLWWKLLNTKDKEGEAWEVYRTRNMQPRAWKILSREA